MNESRTSEEEELFDHFSRLPESVIHQILSILPFKDIVRCSVLSKTWNRIWFNYPNIELALRAHIFSHLQRLFRPRRPLLDHIEGILEQCLFRKASIQRLQLRIFDVSNMEEFAPNMDRWLGAAIDRNVSELVLEVDYLWKSFNAPQIFYSIPERVVVAHSLKVLEVAHCRFEEDRFSCIELSHLQKLKLSWCHFLGENVLNKILFGCPELEFVKVINCCHDVGSFISISCNPKLKYLCISSGKELKRIEIFAPSLETFEYISQNQCAIDLETCTALKHLYLQQQAVGQIKISSPCLKRLVLRYFISFPGAIIDLPNLLDLDFAFEACNLDFKFSSWNVPKLEKVHMCFSGKSFSSVCKAGLEGFLMKLHNYESLKLFIGSSRDEDGRNMILHEKLAAVPFSSLNKFLIEAYSKYVIISSRREEYFFTKAQSPFGGFPVRLSLIFSSRQSIESLYKNLSKACLQWRLNNTFQLVSTVEHEMDSFGNPS